MMRPVNTLIRRSLNLAVAISVFCVAGCKRGPAPGGAATAKPAPTPTPSALIVVSPAATEILRTGILIDGHNDLPWQIRKLWQSDMSKVDLRVEQPQLQTDIPRLRRGGMGAQFWSVYVPPETAHTHNATSMALEQIDLIERMIRQYSDTFELARTADDVERIHAAGKIASFMGVEGGHMIEGSLQTLHRFYGRGARYMGLTHSESIEWADSCSDEPRCGGLCPFGERVVEEMNRLGMLVDIAHVSHDTMRDALRVSKAPVIASHSGAYAVAEHARNVPDDVLRMIRDNGGVVMVNFFSGYAHPEGARQMAGYFEREREFHEKYPEAAEFEKQWKTWKEAHPIPNGDPYTIVDHVDHIVKIAGIDCVGFGSDYDGISRLPVQLEDVSGYPFLIQALLNRGYSADDIHKIMGGNLLRALRKSEEIARSSQ
jgi:membrane dipeptidase